MPTSFLFILISQAWLVVAVVTHEPIAMFHSGIWLVAFIATAIIGYFDYKKERELLFSQLDKLRDSLGDIKKE